MAAISDCFDRFARMGSLSILVGFDSLIPVIAVRKRITVRTRKVLIMWNSLNIQYKIFASFGTVLIMLGGLASYSVYSSG
ncbi:MAG: hypothetical protein AAFP68_07560, partial [Pseudomonadota bacterium]